MAPLWCPFGWFGSLERDDDEADESNKYEQLEGYSKSRRSLTMPSSLNVISMGYQKKVDIDEVIGSLPSNPPAKKRLKQKFLLIIINNFN